MTGEVGNGENEAGKAREVTGIVVIGVMGRALWAQGGTGSYETEGL